MAQRLKRTPSIIAKLRRFDKMQLARMQDIGGLRAVVPTVGDVRELQEAYKKSQFNHQLVSERDYISEPKSDGYRSVHLVYRYINDGAPKYNGLQIELQLRTKLQHAWATAVETMGTFLGQALKSRQGEPKWLAFFEITGSAFACIERTPLVQSCASLTRTQIFQRVAKAERELAVLEKLAGFSHAINIITGKGQGAYHLIVLNSQDHTVKVQPYSRADLSRALEEYAHTEARINDGEPIEAVLVSAGPVVQLRRAYPNYFLDTEEFVSQVRSIIRSATRSRTASAKFGQRRKRSTS